MRKPKVFAWICLTALAAGLLAACGQTQPSASTPSAQTSSSPTATASQTPEAEEPYVAKVLSITFTGEPIADNAAAKLALEEYTNSKIEFTWVADSNYEDKINVMMASNSLPTIVVMKGLTASVISNARAGAFWDITGELSKYPNLSQTNEIVLNNIAIDGKVFGVPRTRVLGRNGISYRKDWLENVGLSEPKTIEDVYKMLYAFTYNDPDQNGQNDTYGMTWCKWYGPLDIIATWFGAGNQYELDDTGTLIPYFTTEAYMESLRWSKKLYDEGLVNEDFAVRDSAIWTDDFKAEKAGVFIDVADQGQRLQTELDKVGKTDSVWVIGSVEGPKGLRNLPTTGHAGMVVVTKNGAKNEAELAKALQFLDRCNDKEAQDIFNYGLVDRDYTINSEGQVVRNADAVANLGKENEGLNQFMMNVVDLVTPEAMLPIYKQVAYVQKVVNPPLCIANPCQSLISSSNVYAEKGSALDQIFRDARIQFIVGDIDEAGHGAAVETWKSQGGNDLMKELNEMYKKAGF